MTATRWSRRRRPTPRSVRDSDGTLALTRGVPSGGTALTVRVATEFGRPVLVVDLACAGDPGRVRSWVRQHGIEVLNVAGPRESKCPGIHREAAAFLEGILPAGESPGEA